MKLKIFGNLLIGLIIHLESWKGVVAASPSPRIAVIGGGIGGTSVAYFVKELLPDAQMEIFEKTDLIGGRLNLTTVFGNGYETGGSIIHPKNKYAVDLSAKFNLQPRTDNGEALSIIKDGEFVFNTSKWTIITIFKTLARYGFDFNRVESLIGEIVHKFGSIYNLQEKGQTFNNPEEMLTAMDPQLFNLTQWKFRSFLEEQGLGDAIIDELIQAITFVNYGQDLNIHAFVGSVAAAGAGSELWSISNGNKQLPEALAKYSKAKVHLRTEINDVRKNEDGTFTLSSSKKELPGIYDQVVIALPLDASSHIKFTDFSKLPYEYPKSRKYHRMVATIIAGWTHPEYKFRSDIISCVPNWYNSISLIHPTVLVVAEKYPVYKIFSPKPLTEKQLDSIFAERHHVEVHDWLAYPEYDQIPPKFQSFILSPNLYYLNAIEWAASAMEMSLISGKNIALLISQDQNKV